MNYAQALEYLDSVREQGAKLALDNVQNLIRNLPFPASGMDFIQVAGTNGKGSTSHFIAAILKASGVRTGLFTSPHLQTIRERIAVDGEPVSPEDFARSLDTIRGMAADLVRRGRVANMPTYFEHVFLTALHVFHTHDVSAAVMEVGLGGRLDATTSLTPAVTAITNISFDHTKTLGSRIRDIAREKAGIVKTGVPLVCGCPPRTAARRVIESTCSERQAPFHLVTRQRRDLSATVIPGGYDCQYSTEEGSYRYRVGMNGVHQARNAAAAIRISEIFLRTRGGLDPRIAAAAIGSVSVPGRIEEIPGDPIIFLDGGHNMEGTRALRRFLEERSLNHLTIIFGVLRDKPYRRMAAMLAPYAEHIIVTEPVSHRALPAEKTARCFPSQSDPVVERDYARALSMARTFGRTVLITGSLYMAGAMRSLILGGAP